MRRSAEAFYFSVHNSAPEGTYDRREVVGSVREVCGCRCGHSVLRKEDQGRSAGHVLRAAGWDLKPVAELWRGPCRLRQSGAVLQRNWDEVAERGRPALAEPSGGSGAAVARRQESEGRGGHARRHHGERGAPLAPGPKGQTGPPPLMVRRWVRWGPPKRRGAQR
ncbi:hypothetical protein NDU88_003414 [Pleurodeles waltl]|uniref:Uncharacterized protein n=1 Tax=Pleurodeles waltl TaxID=8319 RepID=A0AAV7UYF0_PLEWA|nr:hypothetical protein NDU88_003414 [Pleurodeles waltl]